MKYVLLEIDLSLSEVDRAYIKLSVADTEDYVRISVPLGLLAVLSLLFRCLINADFFPYRDLGFSKFLLIYWFCTSYIRL
jgi:hypothetical protein